MSANDAETRAVLLKYLKLPQNVVNNMTLPRIKSELSIQQINFWIDLARDDGLLPRYSKITAQSVLFP